MKLYKVRIPFPRVPSSKYQFHTCTYIKNDVDMGIENKTVGDVHEIVQRRKHIFGLGLQNGLYLKIIQMITTIMKRNK